jgi:glycine cleavage system H lipoate-binding protein
MLVKIFNFLFKSKSGYTTQGNLLNELKKHPNFRSKEEIQKSIDYGKTIHDNVLKKDEIVVISVPDLGRSETAEVTAWIKKNGDIVKSGDVICEVENSKVLMEFESYFDGIIMETCEVNVKLNPGDQLCKIKGV